MRGREITNVDVSEDWVRWGLGALGATVAAGAAMVGRGVNRNIDEVRKDVRDLDNRTQRSVDDIWEVINAERALASKARERLYERLGQTPTRDEMHAGIRDVKADIGKLADLIRGEK